MLLLSLIITQSSKEKSVLSFACWSGDAGQSFKPVGKEDITEVGNKPLLQGIKVRGQVTTV